MNFVNYPSYIGELYYNRDRDSQEEKPDTNTKALAFFLCILTLHIERKLLPQFEGVDCGVNTEYTILSDDSGVNTEHTILGDENADLDLDESNRKATCKNCPLFRRQICKPLTTIAGGIVQTHAVIDPGALQNPDLELAGLIGYQDTDKFSHVALVSEINPDFIV